MYLRYTHIESCSSKKKSFFWGGSVFTQYLKKEYTCVCLLFINLYLHHISLKPAPLIVYAIVLHLIHTTSGDKEECFISPFERDHLSCVSFLLQIFFEGGTFVGFFVGFLVI